MSTPDGYVLTPGFDAPDMLHLNPRSGQDDGCGGRKWGTGDLDSDSIVYQRVDEATALAMLNKGQVIACRRCDLRERAVAHIEHPEARAG